MRRGPIRPSWIVNVSNDSWFGVTSGPLQHLNQASYRAIEEGLPIVRVTPNGVSAVIDPFGRIVQRSRLGPLMKGVVDVQLPGLVSNTTYGSLGDGPLAAVLIMSLLVSHRGVLSRIAKISASGGS